jgi:hypothetical protein
MALSGSTFLTCASAGTAWAAITAQTDKAAASNRAGLRTVMASLLFPIREAADVPENLR